MPEFALLWFLIARPVTEKIKSLLLRRDEFETLNVIGRGAFGEVNWFLCNSMNKLQYNLLNYVRL